MAQPVWVHVHAHSVARISQLAADEIVLERRIAEQKDVCASSRPASRQVFLILTTLPSLIPLYPVEYKGTIGMLMLQIIRFVIMIRPGIVTAIA